MYGIGETLKVFLHTENPCLLGEDLVPVSKDKPKMVGKGQPDLGALSELELMSLFTPKAATKNIRLLFF